MPYLVGVDEAGYGPNLGPLIISATAWWTDKEPAECDLYSQLRAAVVSRTIRAVDDPRIAIADSKKLYKSGGGVAELEYGVLSALAACRQKVRVWRDVWESLAGETGAHLQAVPWYENYSIDLPVDAELPVLAQRSDNFQSVTGRTGARLVAMKSVAVFPRQFNELVSQFDSKGAALTRLTLELLSDIFEHTAAEPTLVVCDKHGGRNRYADQLQEHFPEYLIEIYGESRPQSVYRWGPSAQRVEIRFQSRGESFLPAALASMTSKYLRELAMMALNDFWRLQISDLRATAGYPADAKRFKSEIKDVQAALQIDDELLWRCR
ncbi:MAG: hypothetical protein VB835_18550 [Pirellulales bacterium]